jgi:hypothetical protein
VTVNQVEQREKENPDDIDKVPVEAGDIDRSHIFGREPPAHGVIEKPGRMPAPMTMCSACRPVMAK